MPTQTSPNKPRPALSAEDQAALRRIRQINPEADPLAHLPDVPPSRLPRHVAIIMDGNGRWAAAKGFARIFGHRNGAAAVREVIMASSDVGIEVLTLFSFSSENWKRPDDEITQLMGLYVQYMAGEREELIRHNIRFRQIGRREGLPAETLAALDAMVEATASCTGPTLCLAVNYGARAEITDACRAIAEKVKLGELQPQDIAEQTITEHLATAGLPDPDLLIRTAGEMRLSNYLLWQLSYAELYITDTLWPDFARADYFTALRNYANRHRRFGGLNDSDGVSPGS